MNMRVGIIGGGAAGMMAAVTAAKNGHEVTILEAMPRIGKKLLLTGSGKCNLSNSDMDIMHFHGDAPEMISHVLTCVSPDKPLMFLESLGLVCRNRNGYIYPNTEQATTVLDVFLCALRSLKVCCHTDEKVTDIIRTKDGFVVIATNKYSFDKLIVATGLKACPKTGSDGNLLPVIERLGHKLNPVEPALVQLVCSDKYCKNLAGIRIHGKVSLYIDGNYEKSEEGEIQLTDYGISGIPVFQLSYMASRALSLGSKVTVQMDWLPAFSGIEEICSFLKKVCFDKSCLETLLGILPKNICFAILKSANIKPDLLFEKLSASDIRRIASIIKSFDFHVTGNRGFESAQICCGGIDFASVNGNLESIHMPGLYFAGEILDVNGDCGGYNLTWAFCSGILAGELRE